MITVAQLIEHLQTLDQSLPVCFKQFSDLSELELTYIEVMELQFPRGDGYVGRKRPDRPAQKWVVFPGN